MEHIESKDTKRGDRLFLEALEERIAPAGNVVVVVSGGNMTITGDAENNNIEIEETAPDQFHIVGSDGTTINGSAEYYADSVTGGAKIIMGAGLDEVHVGDASFSKSVSIDQGTGDGLTSLGKNFDTAGTLTISAKDGHQIVDVGGEVVGKTTVKLGGMDGSDIGLYADFGDDVKLQLGAGDDVITASEAHLDGDLQVIAGKGRLDVSLDDSGVYGGLFVQNAQDNSRLSLNGTYVFGGLKLVVGKGDTWTEVIDSSVMGALDVKGGIGDDTFVANGATLTGAIKIQNGQGGSIVGFTSCFVGVGYPGAHAHDVFVNNAMGTSSFDVQGGNFNANKLTLNYGKGQTTVQVRDADIFKDFSMKNSEGQVWLGLFDSTVAGKTTITTGSDTDYLYLDGVHLSGALAISTGKSLDGISIDFEATAGNTSTFDGKVTIASGDGDDSIYIGEEGVPGNKAIFNSSVTIDGGKGSDSIVYLLNGNTFAVPLVLKSVENEI